MEYISPVIPRKMKFSRLCHLGNSTKRVECDFLAARESCVFGKQEHGAGKKGQPEEHEKNSERSDAEMDGCFNPEVMFFAEDIKTHE